MNIIGILSFTALMALANIILQAVVRFFKRTSAKAVGVVIFAAALFTGSFFLSTLITLTVIEMAIAFGIAVVFSLVYSILVNFSAKPQLA